MFISIKSSKIIIPLGRNWPAQSHQTQFNSVSKLNAKYGCSESRQEVTRNNGSEKKTSQKKKRLSDFAKRFQSTLQKRNLLLDCYEA